MHNIIQELQSDNSRLFKESVIKRESDADNKEFFDQVAIDRAKGAEWHYVGKSALDPTAKSIPLQCMIHEEGKESVPCGEPYIYYKLKIIIS